MKCKGNKYTWSLQRSCTPKGSRRVDVLTQDGPQTRTHHDGGLEAEVFVVLADALAFLSVAKLVNRKRRSAGESRQKQAPRDNVRKSRGTTARVGECFQHQTDSYGQT